MALIQRARSPVCLLGSQITLPPSSTHALVEALEVELDEYQSKMMTICFSFAVTQHSLFPWWNE